MRSLTNTEITHIFGAIICIEPSSFIAELHREAYSDGISAGIVVSALAVSISYGLSSNPLISLGAAVVLAPYAFNWGYFNSPAWDLV